MKMCPRCKKAHADPQDKFCYECGTLLMASPKCSCGRELLPSNVYCPTCGKEVERND